MIKLTFLKKLILLTQVHRKSVIFVTTGIFSIKSFSLKYTYATDAMIY